MRSAFLRRVALCVLAFAVGALPAAAEIYKWTDSSGKVHYSDKPPPEAKKQPVKIEAQSFGGPPQMEGWARDVLRSSAATEKTKAVAGTLTMYATAWCGYCRRARAHLAQRGIAYREVDIEASDANKAEFRKHGGRGVPLFVAGDKKMRGYRADALDDFLAAIAR
jgi:glutaredoxin